VSERPLVSVVIPAYNCAQYVAQAVESVLRQSIGAPQIETIVLDDGSSDETPAVVRRFGDAVRLVQLNHGGVARARNTGIEMARAELVAFLDADDYWLPKRLQRALELFAADPHIQVNTEYFVETAGEMSTTPYYQSRGLRCLFELSAPSQLDFALEDNFINSMVIAPRSALIDAGGFNPRLRYGEDWDLWLRLLKAGYAARLVREPSAVYRYQRPGATTTRHDAGMAADRLFVLNQYGSAVSPYRRQKALSLLRRLQLRQTLGRFIPAH
jgi:glycosyltransferase involved in cell wall biosynthesis